MKIKTKNLNIVPYCPHRVYYCSSLATFTLLLGFLSSLFCDTKQILRSKIYSFDIHKIKHMSWFEK